MAKIKVRDLNTAVSAKYGRFKNNAISSDRYDEYKNLLANEVSIIDKATKKPIPYGYGARERNLFFQTSPKNTE